MPLRELPAERVVVCGAGYTGQAIARALCGLGKQVSVTDSRQAGSVAGADETFASLGAALHWGGHDEDLVGAADLVVVSPGVSVHEPAVAAAARRGRPVWGEVELAWHLCPTSYVGITGTKGKSTTAALSSLMLDAPLANSEAYDAHGVPLIELVTDQPELPLVVVELSSYQLEAVDAFRPTVATLLNIAEDHTARHPTRESYVAAKRRIFRNQQPGDRSVCNRDDETVRQIADELPTVRLLISDQGEVEAGVWSGTEGVEIRLPDELGGATGRLLDWPEVAPPLRTQRPSFLAAAATALAAGATPERVREVGRQFAGLPHRMETVRVWRGLTFVNDSKATNPLATINAIRQSPRPVVLIAGNQTKGIDLSPLLEPFRSLRGLVLIGQDAPLLAAVAQRAGLTAVRRAPSLEAAVDAAIELAHEEDWIVLSPCGASFDMFKDFADRGDRFRTIVAGLGGF